MPDGAAVPDVVALDIETTGLYPHLGDRICEIALLKIRQGELAQRLVTLVNPEREISFSAQLINGITADMVACAPTFREVAGTVLSFIRDETLLIHNARFDLAFLKIQAQACGLEFPDTRLVDTLYLARRFFRFESNSLPDLARACGIRQEKAHRAESDAMTAFLLFREFYQTLREYGVPDEEVFSDTSRVDTGLCVFENLPPAVMHALERKETVCLTYTHEDGHLSRREVRPLEVMNENGIWYLAAFCEGGERRMFRLDRIVEVVEQFE